ncbi:MAG TPA: D-alanyl-D-alanine carboxypeptidase/D-alanyl-D-alanine-endopeptidase [Actinomycetaceae bacterium]|nr:D-alanyl-D-alanine carboxypeptidase/D-alanyl-D-alanine-endopeptidase [Actinomycetaceae bacterium]
MRIGKILAGLLAVVLLVGYIVLDSADVVPGLLTTRPKISEPVAYPVPEVAPRSPNAGAYAPDPAPASDVTAALAEFVASPVLGPRPAVDLRDGATGARLAAHNPTQLGPPASSTKVLTAAAALARLGPASTIKTTALLDGETVVLVGGGDLLLGTGEPSEDADGRASLTDLASQTAAALQARGITEVSLGVDSTLFEGPGSPSWSELDYRWVIRMTPLAMHGGMNGETYASNRDYTIYTGQVFATELAAHGITVAGEPVRLAAAEGTEQIGVIESAPIEEVTGWMLKTSNNSVAEGLARLVAIARDEGATAQAAAAAVTAEVTELGLPTAGLVLHDTCGLAGENLVTAELLAKTVQFALSGTDPRLNPLVPWLPVAYLDGTLDDRIRAAPGVVRAKTGTLSQVVSLTGVVDADSGAVVVFSIVAAGLDPGDVLAARTEIDRFVTRLREIA